MRDVDQPHDAEDQRQAGGEHGVEPADQHALQDDVEPLHRRHTPKYAAEMLSRVSSRCLALQRDAAFLQAIDLARGLERLRDVLLDHDQRQALRHDRRQPRVDVAHHDRRQSEADLVAQQQARVRHQRARDGAHLLLAAGQRRRGQVPPLGQHRKQVVDALQRPRAGAARLAADQQVLLDRQRGKQSPAFRHQCDAAAEHLESWLCSDRRAVEQDVAAARRHHAGDGFQQRALAGAVGADHRHHLAGVDRERDAEQRLEVAVKGVDGAHLEERIRHRRRSPCRSPPPAGCGSPCAGRPRR